MHIFKNINLSNSILRSKFNKSYKKYINKKPKLLSPAGSIEMLYAAIDAGADAVYLGIKGLNMRSRTSNFDIKELKKIVNIAHNKNVEVYLTVNIIIFNKELDNIKKLLFEAKKANVDAIIAWDLSVISLAKKLGLNIHLSTQASVSNILAVKEYYKLGVSRFILARECSLEDISEIKRQVKNISKDIEIEIFVHGAMCVAISGRCFLSEFLYGVENSANRGKCIQPCRRKYIIKDPETEKELEVHNNYILSPKDLCTLPFIDKILEIGVDVLKIEGRGRSPEYAKIVTECYREAIDKYFDGKLNEEIKKDLLEKLKTVYNRGFSSGFYLGKPIGQWAKQYGSIATRKKVYVGKIIKVYNKINVGDVKIESGSLSINDNILIIGKKGVQEEKIKSMQEDVGVIINSAKKGDIVAIKFDSKIRVKDKIYLFEEK